MRNASRPTAERPARYPWRTALAGAVLIVAVPHLFYLVDSGQTDAGLALVQLVVINPLVFYFGVLRSWFRYGNPFWITLLAYSAAFLVTLVTPYNFTALPYLIGYVALPLLTMGVIILARRSRKRHSERQVGE